MSSTEKHEKYTESIISYCLLTVLFVIAAVIIARQFDFGKLGNDTKSSNKFPGFVPAADAKEYNEETLYEKINGKAPMYTDAGFVKLTTQVLALTDNGQLQMELYIYDMTTAQNAFSVYSTQKRADSENLSNMTFGYKTSNAVYFAHNKYYVEMIGFDQSKELIEKMAQLAPVLLKNEPETAITELDYFPAENLIAGSQKLYLASAFSCEQLSDVFTAGYNINSRQITAFFSKRSNTDDAKTMAKAYYDFLISMGSEQKSLKDSSLDAKILETFGYVEILFTVGDFVGGVHQAQDKQAAEQLTKELINKLSVYSKK